MQDVDGTLDAFDILYKVIQKLNFHNCYYMYSINYLDVQTHCFLATIVLVLEKIGHIQNFIILQFFFNKFQLPLRVWIT